MTFQKGTYDSTPVISFSVTTLLFRVLIERRVQTIIDKVFRYADNQERFNIITLDYRRILEYDRKERYTTHKI